MDQHYSNPASSTSSKVPQPPRKPLQRKWVRAPPEYMMADITPTTTCHLQQGKAEKDVDGECLVPTLDNEEKMELQYAEIPIFGVAQ